MTGFVLQLLQKPINSIQINSILFSWTAYEEKTETFVLVQNGSIVKVTTGYPWLQATLKRFQTTETLFFLSRRIFIVHAQYFLT